MGQPIYAFGSAGRYFISDGAAPWLNDLPESLDNKLGALDADEFFPAWISCAFGRGERHIFTFYQGSVFTIYYEDLPPKLEAWLFDPATGAHLRDVQSLRVTFGEGDAFFAMDKNGFRWDELPELLENRVQGFLIPVASAKERRTPRVVVLGKNGSFVMVDSKGGKYSSAGLPVQLYNTLRDLKNGEAITCLALDALNHQPAYFLALDDRDAPIYHIPETRRRLNADTVQLADRLIESFRERKAKSAQLSYQADILSLSSLKIQAPPPPPQDWSGLDYLVQPPTNQGLNNARSFNDMRSAIAIQESAQLQAAQLQLAQARLVAQIRINESAAAGSAAISDAIW